MGHPFGTAPIAVHMKYKSFIFAISSKNFSKKRTEMKCLGFYITFNGCGHISTGVSWDDEAKYARNSGEV